MMKKVMMIGSTCVDVILHVEHLPVSEEDVNVKSMAMRMGGCAFNASCVLQREQVPFDLFSPVGTGMYGRFVRGELEKRGIPFRYESREENGVCFCLVEADGGRTFLAVHGAEYHFPHEIFRDVNVQAYGCAYVSGIDMEEDREDVLFDEVKELRKNGIPVWYACGPRIQDVPVWKNRALLEMGVKIHCNKDELDLLGKALDLMGDLLPAVHALTKEAVIVTHGADPVQYIDRDGSCGSVACESIRAVNGTGAGDSHIGMIMACMMKELTLRESIIQANRVSAEVASSEESHV